MTAINQAAGLVRAHEGCRLEAYQDAGDRWTIGWGHAGPEVHQGLSWTQEQADGALAADLMVAAEGVGKLKSRLLSDQQTAALVSLAFNIGLGALKGSVLIDLVNECRWPEAAKQFLRFDHVAGVESKGLLIRRLDEAALFLRGS